MQATILLVLEFGNFPDLAASKSTSIMCLHLIYRERYPWSTPHPAPGTLFSMRKVDIFGAGEAKAVEERAW